MELDLKTILEQIEIAPEDKQKLDLLESAIDLSITANKEEEVYRLRCELIELSTSIGYPLKGLVAFTQNLAYADDKEDEELQWELMWEYRWIISIAPNFHQITMEQIKDLLKDFRTRLLGFGDSIRAYYTMYFVVAMRIHDIELVKKYRGLRLPSPMGILDECKICILDDEVAFLGYTEGYNAAKAKAKDILSGEVFCDNVPDFTHTLLIMAALKDGEIEEASIYREKILKDMNNIVKRVNDIGFLLISYIAEGKTTEALDLFEKAYPKSQNKSISGIAYLSFHMGASLLFSYLHQNEPQKRPSFPFAFKDLSERKTAIDIKDLDLYFKNITQNHMTLFDDRNANTYFKDTYKNYQEVLKLK